ncbi:hypothetical protein [Bilophila wadsworthia]|nr:hypothetical protein [Bilophila wadsworthia]
MPLTVLPAAGRRRALETLPKERVAFLSGMMAITMCAILDKLGQYEFGVE